MLRPGESPKLTSDPKEVPKFTSDPTELPSELPNLTSEPSGGPDTREEATGPDDPLFGLARLTLRWSEDTCTSPTKEPYCSLGKTKVSTSLVPSVNTASSSPPCGRHDICPARHTTSARLISVEYMLPGEETAAVAAAVQNRLVVQSRCGWILEAGGGWILEAGGG